MTPRPWTLTAAAALAAAETAVLIAVVGLTRKHGADIVITFLAVKFPFCWLLARRQPAAYLAVLVWELAAGVAALGGSAPVGWRLLEIVAAATVVTLVIVSTPLFPAVHLPEST